MREIWEAFKLAIIRFWENRFLVNDEVEFLRSQLDRIHGERVKLLNYILELNKPETTSIVDTEDFKPIGKPYVPWSVKKHQLEKESLEKLERDLLNSEKDK